ncbi:hypothetical protein Pyn_22568 [Prunus yedoensis var. nudiflora]|uniref:Uncharacterized protein n=1 Tax=Prunus yedoensis var. nudiflora TaxID=2094558 RepID=A0A314ZN47_PRUYE|nr:hypothetical protein Pyn_22568 [Prunus yedoensis var. nudiflora]
MGCIELAVIPSSHVLISSWEPKFPILAGSFSHESFTVEALSGFLAAVDFVCGCYGSVSTDGSDASPFGSPDRASSEIQRQPSDDDIPLLPCSLLCPREFISSHLLFVGSAIFPAALHPSSHRTGLAQRDF